MVKYISRVGIATRHYLVPAVVATVLTACGGSSGDSTPEDVDGDGIPDIDDPFIDADEDGRDDISGYDEVEANLPVAQQDVDRDGIPNGLDLDADGDGVDDIDDPYVDVNFDNLDDISGYDEVEANLPVAQQDFDRDGTPNGLDLDADGDGVDDISEDPYIDLNFDNVDDDSEKSESEAGDTMFSAVSAGAPCGSEAGSDSNSSNANWNDNCEVRRNDVRFEGQFADSLYAVGIQRIVYCEGYGGGASYIDFADGEFGPGTESAVEAWQSDNGLTVDGRVGPGSWAALQSKIQMLDGDGFTDGAITKDPYGFTEGRCAGIHLFYQTVTALNGGLSVELGGWELARNQPNEAEAIPFSVGSPFGRL